MSTLRSEILRLLDPEGTLWHGGPTVSGFLRDDQESESRAMASTAR